MADSAELEVQIRGLMLDPVTQMPIVILKEIATERVLPIWVGVFEANAIAFELDKTAMPRPMTHDLLRNLGRALGARATRVVVSDLRDDTFYATVWLDHAGETVVLDARPSDAIAMALRWDCPVFVAAHVLTNARQNESVQPASTVQTADGLRAWLENLGDDEAGGYKM